MFRRLREEAPLYYNERHDFYALSRFDDCERAFTDRETFISGRGSVLEAIKNDIPVPPGLFISEDPPLHTVHRGVSRECSHRSRWVRSNRRSGGSVPKPSTR